MCENLIFTGIKEVQLGQNEQEDCERTLKMFLAKDMFIHDDIKFDRIHRLGRYERQQARPRPIIAKFHNYKDKEMVKHQVPAKLTNTEYGVREQYPYEYEQRRKILYPEMKAAKSNTQNRVRMVNDTLYINNEKIICGPDNTLVKVVYQEPYSRSQNANAYRFSERRDIQTQSRYRPQSRVLPSETENSGLYRHTQEQQTVQNREIGGERPKSTWDHLTRIGNSTGANRTPATPREVNFESRNLFMTLPQDDSGNDRYVAGEKGIIAP